MLKMPSTPLYQRIQDQLRSDIAAGRFAGGKPLPSESELARTYDTTRSTVRMALAQLSFEGLIIRQKGRGTFVGSRPLEGHLQIQPEKRPQSIEEQAEAAGAGVTFRLIGFSAEPATPEICAMLGVGSSDVVYRLRRLRCMNAIVVGYEDRWLAADIGCGITVRDLTTRSMIAIAEHALGRNLGGMTVRVLAETATAEIARLLEIGRGKAILRRTHTFFDHIGRAVVAGDALYRADMFAFTYHFGRTGQVDRPTAPNTEC